ncbi:hypothetical protein PMPD1_4401 (plasmid) [Paramixta manurensis]|uniref:Uncharacterized protein n=1 Tax=Paramixta manurensis TaxID=2740817 RepID=A0A6M8UHC6_9GAMM|nr:hypothetical protein PMPD1_4401 [Erwiniaceae bacterium PD-1]
MTHPAEITAQPVVRDCWGGWVHPDFFNPATTDNDFYLKSDFRNWLTTNNLMAATTWMENDITDEHMAQFWTSGNCSSWTPSRPAGEGWFIGCFHYTEDGPLCIWLRKNPGAWTP